MTLPQPYTSLQQQPDQLFKRFTQEEHTYSGEQLAELHLQTTSYLFHLEQTLPQDDKLRYELNRLRWTLNIDPLNSALHHEVCLLVIQLRLRNQLP